MRHRSHLPGLIRAAGGLRACGLAGLFCAASLACADKPHDAPVDAGVSDVEPQVDAGALPVADAAGPREVLPSRVCSADDWCWDGAGLHNDSLYAVAGSAPDDLWAVGELGMALHFDGQRWTSRWAPTGETLRAIWVHGGEAWAVGDGATVLHYVNQEWRSEVVAGVAAGAALRSVAGNDEGDVWIAGTAGVLLQLHDDVWGSVEAASGASLNAVWAGGAEVWAVGDGGFVLHRDDAGWARVDAGTNQNLLAVSGHGDQVWLAGASGEIRRLNGETQRWERPVGEGPAPQGQLGALQVGDEQVMVGNATGQLYVWDESATCPVPGDAGAPHQPCPEWRDVRNTGSELPILGLWASDAVAVAVGAFGSITRWNDETRSIDSQGSLDNYLDVSGSPTGQVWIAGDRLLRSSPTGWHEVSKDSPRAVYTVQPLASERTLIAGTGGLARGYAGSDWQNMDVRADAWLRALYADSDGAWLVGSRGASWGLLNGRLWTPLATPTDHDLLAVYGVPSGAVWAVGAGGVTLRHDGVQWAAVPSGPDGGVSADLRGVWASAEDDVWAVGTGGIVLHWDGRLWKPIGEPASYSLNAVWGRGSDDVWAVGSGGTVLHYDGAAWTLQHSGSAQSLNAIWGNAQRVWAVGEHGSILVKDLE